MQATYLSMTETAKLIRAALKRSFPKVKFSVRCSRGSAIYVDWTDGPAATLVNPIASQFRGGSFDGSIDMRIGHKSWLLPDGSACVASDDGTLYTGGCIPPTRTWMPHPEAKLVSFGADFVFTNRRMSPTFAARVAAKVADKWGDVGLGVEVSNYDGSAYFTGDYDATRKAHEIAGHFMVVGG